MTAYELLPSGALRVRVGPTGNAFYEGKWRLGGRQRIQAHRLSLARARRRRLAAASRTTAAGHLRQAHHHSFGLFTARLGRLIGTIQP